MRDMLEALALKYPTRFHLHYTLDSPPAAGSWGGSVGFITEQMIQDHLPAPGPGTVRTREGRGGVGRGALRRGGECAERPLPSTFTAARSCSSAAPAPPVLDQVVLMCGPPPMVQYACKANLEKLGYDKKDMLAF